MENLRRFNDHPMWDQGFTKNIYRFPFSTDIDFSESGAKLAIGLPENEISRAGQYYFAKSPQSHLSPYKWAIDFLIPDGTEILAAEEGYIEQAVDNFDQWGPTEDFRSKLNFITIKHAHGERSQYCHLEKDSFTNTGLYLGRWVNKGQLIARVGKTGWTDRDHLHFMVFALGRLPESLWNFYSLKIRFE